jgi:CRISPR/Cas system-associated endoribonuclease Cas2
MSVYLITYDLNQEAKRPPIVKTIKDTFNWARLSESSYAVSTSSSAKTIYDALSKHIDGNDQIYVIRMTQPWNGFGPKDVNNWLDQHLEKS